MTREEIGSVLKRLRMSCGFTQKEVAEKLGRKQQIVGHWETGYAQPDANTLFTLCDIYGVTVDGAFGFRRNNEISITEYDHIKKYRSLDTHGKEMVDFTLQKEWERSTAKPIQESKTIPVTNKEENLDYLTPQPANNDHEFEPGEQEKMQEDLSNLKIPD